MTQGASAKTHRSWRRRVLRGGSEWRRLGAEPGFRSPATVAWLYAEVVKHARVDVPTAARFAEAARRLAVDLGDARSRALAFRADGHVAFLKGEYGEALEQFRRALGLFHRLGADLDEGRTLSSSLQALIYLGRYGEALRWADRAREIFTVHRDRLRLARLDLNVANVLYRQDRFEDAHRLYGAALREFRKNGDPQDVAAALENRAVCEISLNDFDAALASYGEAREHCERHRLPLLVAVADYNIAYLFFLRGEYTRAIELYDVARARARRLGDAYHEALCDLDQSEMLLQLNLVERAATLAERAYVRFERLGTRYEAAKALLFLALAARRQGHTERALPLFVKARRLFVREKNSVWPFLIDLYQAVLLHEEGRLSEAERLGRTARDFFSKTPLAEKEALCELLLARVALTRGHLAQADLWASRALEPLERVDAPATLYQVLFVLGQIREARGDAKGAYRMFRRARTRLEGLRGQLAEEELKIAFLKDKLEVYERLVQLSLFPKGAGRPSQREAAFRYIEEAKSRSLADQISFRAHLLPARRSVNVRAVERVHRLREELHFVERRLALSEADPVSGSEKVRRRLRSRARAIEAGLSRELTRLRGREDEFRSLQNAGTLPLREVREALDASTTLLEYYQVGEQFLACVLHRTGLEIVPLGSVSAVRERFSLLQFQLSKFRLGKEYVDAFAESLHLAALTHLSALHELLVSPVRRALKGRRLVIVPHGFLHYIPFHALFDGALYLSEEFAVSYAPSASVYGWCVGKPGRYAEESLVLGVPDAATPHIRTEVRAVAGLLPKARLFMGARATAAQLRKHGRSARYIHIATHGLFRQDNPMFSSVRLGGSDLSLFDLYGLELSAELVTLSGCGTGLNVVVGGDELLGLVRGLLYAGAHAVLGTLWDVNDESTSTFMRLFYERARRTPDRAEALREAMAALRESHPHPYYWAPFVLIGHAAGA